MRDRNATFRSQQHQSRIEAHAHRLQSVDFFNVLTGPQELTVREIKVDGQVLVTTMLNHRNVSKRELAKLYEHRWNIEMDFRNIKTTLGVEVLSCKTPQMSEKELWVYLLAYNVIRLLMAQAALHAGVNPRQLSFKHTVQIWTEWVAQGLAGIATVHNDVLFRTSAQARRQPI